MLNGIPGGDALVEWFGLAPRFHDCKLLEISFTSKGEGVLRIHAWKMTDAVDAKGYFVLDKHAVVTFSLREVNQISCTDFDKVPGIILDLLITKVDEHFCLEWSASYGVAGLISAKQMLITLAPGKPD